MSSASGPEWLYTDPSSAWFLPALHEILSTRDPGMLPTHLSLFSSPDSVSFSLQVLEGSQEVALGQVSVDNQADAHLGARAKPRASAWYVGQASPGHWHGGDAETTCPKQLPRTQGSHRGVLTAVIP